MSRLGDVDALRLRSSATRFARAADDAGVFQRVLDAFYDGEPDLRRSACSDRDPLRHR